MSPVRQWAYFHIINDRTIMQPLFCGDRFSAADLAFATLAAPIVNPIGYSIKLPELSDLPMPMATGIAEFRSTPAGKFIIRLYQEQVNS